MRKKLFLTATVLTFAVAGGVAFGAFDGTIVGTDGIIYACAKADGTVRLAGSSHACDTSVGERAFNWNQVGRTGPQGPAGPAYFARVATTDNGTLKPAKITIKSWDYSDGTIWINVPDRDVRQCAVAATPVTTAAGATIVRQPVGYVDWILLFTYAGTTRAQMAADVTLTCDS